MKKLVATALLLSLPAVAQAQSTSREDGSIVVTSSKAVDASERPLTRLMRAPKSCAGALLGVTVGVPVKMAREIKGETLRMRGILCDDMAGADQPDLFARSTSSGVAALYGVPSGIILGAIHGTSRGIDAGYHKPFTRESISLDDDSKR